MERNNSHSTQNPQSTDYLDIRALCRILRERIWLIALCLTTASAATAAYLYRAPNIYASKVVLKLEEEDKKVINIQEVQKENLQSQESLKTVEQMLNTRALLDRVADVNHLESDPRFMRAFQGKPVTREALVSKLSNMVDVRLRKGTRLIDIVVEHTDAALTEQIANSIAREFVKESVEQRSSASKTANVFLLEQATDLKNKLENSENALQGYRQQVFSVSLEDRQNIVVQKLKDLTQRSTELKSQKIAQETLYRRMLQSSNNIAGLMGIPNVASDPAVMELRSAVGKADADLANLKQEYKSKHPKYIQAESQLDELTKALERAVLNVRETTKTSLENLTATETALEAAIHEQETAALDLNRKAIEYNVLVRDVESNRALYQSVLNRIKETDITKDLESDRITLVQRAVTPEKPVKPQKLKVALLGLVAGLMGGILLVLLVNTLDSSVNNVDQAEQSLKLAVLSAIPRFSGNGSGDSDFVQTDSLKSPEAESFRTLRTALSMLGRNEDRRTFLFTSALPAEGKTFCALNYAASLAQQGLRTLIVDGDLRCPMVERKLAGDKKVKAGLTDYLVEKAPFESIVQSSAHENLFFVSAGTDAPNPAELLAQNGIEGLLATALKEFDRVVVDSAPIHAVSDTLLMAGKVQSVCLVVRAHKTSRHTTLRAIQLLRQAGAPMAGIVLNRLARSHTYGYYYGSYYEYSYRSRYRKKAAPAAA